MSTLHVIEELSAYIDGMLPADEQERVERHLESCTECRNELDALNQTLSLIHDLPEIDPPADFVTSVRTQIESDQTEGTVIHWTRSPVIRIGIAACAVAVLSVYGLRNNTYTPASTPEEAPIETDTTSGRGAFDDDTDTASTEAPAALEEEAEKSRRDVARGAKAELDDAFTVGAKRDDMKESISSPADLAKAPSEAFDAPAPAAPLVPGKSSAPSQTPPHPAIASAPPSAPAPDLAESASPAPESRPAPRLETHEAKKTADFANTPVAMQRTRAQDQAKDAEKNIADRVPSGEIVSSSAIPTPSAAQGASAPSFVPPPTEDDVNITMPTLTLYTAQADKVRERVREFLEPKADAEKLADNKGRSNNKNEEQVPPTEIKLFVPKSKLTALIADLQKQGTLLIPPEFFSNRSEVDPVPVTLTIKAK